MRNVVIFSDNGRYSEFNENIKIDPKSKKFIKTVFKENGQIVCIPFINTFKELFYRLNSNSIVLEKLNNIKDEFKVWIIINQIVDNPKDWHKNRFLSTLFNCDIYAENICIFVSEDELNNGIIEVDENENNNFISFISDVCKIITFKDDNEHLDEITLFLNDDEILQLVGDECISFQEEYIGEKMKLKFSEVINLNDNDVIVRKNGAIMHIHENSADFYFCPVYKADDDLNLYKEIIC